MLYLEPLLGGVWWTVGSLAFSAGLGTVVLAAGIGVTAGLVVTLRRRYGAGEPLPPGARSRLVRVVAITVVLIGILSSLLPLAGLGELAVPIACALVGIGLFPTASVLDGRVLIVAGSALLLLGATGALLALDSAGRVYPQGLVGLVAAAAVWACGAQRTGLLAEVRAR